MLWRIKMKTELGTEKKILVLVYHIHDFPSLTRFFLTNFKAVLLLALFVRVCVHTQFGCLFFLKQKREREKKAAEKALNSQPEVEGKKKKI